MTITALKNVLFSQCSAVKGLGLMTCKALSNTFCHILFLLAADLVLALKV